MAVMLVSLPDYLINCSLFTFLMNVLKLVIV